MQASPRRCVALRRDPFDRRSSSQNTHGRHKTTLWCPTRTYRPLGCRLLSWKPPTELRCFSHNAWIAGPIEWPSGLVGQLPGAPRPRVLQRTAVCTRYAPPLGVFCASPPLPPRPAGRAAGRAASPLARKAHRDRRATLQPAVGPLFFLPLARPQATPRDARHVRARPSPAPAALARLAQVGRNSRTCASAGGPSRVGTSPVATAVVAAVISGGLPCRRACMTQPRACTTDGLFAPARGRGRGASDRVPPLSIASVVERTHRTPAAAAAPLARNAGQGVPGLRGRVMYFSPMTCCPCRTPGRGASGGEGGPCQLIPSDRARGVTSERGRV